MPRDPLGLQGSGIETLGKIATPETYRPVNSWGNMVTAKVKSLFGAKAKKSPAMNRRQVSKSAGDLGYATNKDGSFTKKVSKTMKDKKPKPEMPKGKMPMKKGKMKPGAMPMKKKKKGKK